MKCTYCFSILVIGTICMGKWNSKSLEPNAFALSIRTWVRTTTNKLQCVESKSVPFKPFTTDYSWAAHHRTVLSQTTLVEDHICSVFRPAFRDCTPICWLKSIKNAGKHLNFFKIHRISLKFHKNQGEKGKHFFAFESLLLNAG